MRSGRAKTARDMPTIAAPRPPCWGIGLGRTGTNSFCRALQILGYERVVHNPVFERLAHLDGGADNGVAIFYKYLDYKFPGSKFVLTTRPLATWLESMEWISSRSMPVTRANEHAIVRRMALYETVTFDREKYAAGYERHHADVRRYFRDRPDDLLEMSLVDGDGWDVLCPFLGLPVPSEPFPRLHDRVGLETFDGVRVVIGEPNG